MGSCLSQQNAIKPNRKTGTPPISSSRTNLRKNRENLIGLRDFMGVKKSDSIDNFYDIDIVVGRGAFGEVVKAKHIYSAEERAIKIISKQKLQKHKILMQLQLQELGILMKADHPSIMKVHEIVEDAGNYYIISEYLKGGELYDRILQLKKFSEKDCAQIVYQILRGLNYMHQQKIAHRDIKPENILMESKDISNVNLKITDFGFAKCYDPQEGGLSETLGSPLYMAPEIIKKLPYDCAVDIWALGVLTYIMLSGKPPFKGKTKDAILNQVVSKNINFQTDTWKKTSKEAKNFVKQMLIRDASQRATAESLLKDQWIINNLTYNEISEAYLLDIAQNLQQFKKNTTFQHAVMTYIVSQSESQQQLKELREVFIRFDESGDGYLQLSEITDGLKEVLGHVRGSLKIFEDILNTLDKNLNGVIDYTEFLTAAADKEQLLVDNNLRFAFNMFDSDQNGCITKAELRQVFETAEKKDEGLWTEIFQEVDTDGDGVITFDEFRNSMKQVVAHGSSKEKYLLKNDTVDLTGDTDRKNQNINGLLFNEPRDFQ